MKTKNYRHGNTTWKAYMKPVGKGFELGIHCGGKPLFVGNFVNRTDANKFWTIMNQKVQSFAKKYKITKKFPLAWYKKFLSNTIHTAYYEYCGRLLTKYSRQFKTATKKDVRKYSTLKKRLPKAPPVPFKSRAA